MTIDISNKAKPCPLCGSTRIFLEEKHDMEPLGYTLYISCGDCGLRSFKSYTRSVEYVDAESRTLKYWNTRPEVLADVDNGKR